MRSPCRCIHNKRLETDCTASLKNSLEAEWVTRRLGNDGASLVGVDALVAGGIDFSDHIIVGLAGGDGRIRERRR